MMMTVDLHCHSTCSDGTFSPEQLAAMGKDFDVFALTDHDNCDGCGRFLSECAAQGHKGLRLAGIELSIEAGAGYKKFHLLGLGIDPNNARLNEFLEKIRKGRDERNVKILKKINDCGMALTFEEVRRHSGGKVVAKPHFAGAMMEKGWASSIADAFERFLADGKPCDVSRYHPTQEESIDVIHAAGGKAVMAHPKYWTSDFTLLRTGLMRLREMGLDGVEAIYQANEPGETVEHLRIAKALDLAVTAGSDFHGANKPTIKLGMSIAMQDLNFLKW